MEIGLTRIKHVVAVARLGSFSRAAEELRITQPALSRSIAGFEQRFGVRLFDRGRGGAVTTQVGKLVVEEAEAVLRSVRDFEHNLKLFGAGEAGRAAVGFGPLAASLILPRLSRDLLNEVPALRFKAAIKPAEELLPDLLADEIEMIFANSWSVATSAEIVHEPVGSIRLAAIVRGGHPLTARDRVSVADLRMFPVANAVDLPNALFIGDHGAFVCDNYHILRETVLGTDCVWLASPELLADDIVGGQLAVLQVADLGPIENEVSMIRRRGRSLSPAAEAVAARAAEICSA